MRLASSLQRAGKFGSAGLWVVFPVVPLLAEDVYYSLCNQSWNPKAPSGPDPHEWEAAQWALLLGPLIGYGFLAGATWGVEDEPGGRWWLRWASRRSAWVGLGPWLGLWTLGGAGLTLWGLHWVLAALGADRLTRWFPTASLGPNLEWWVGMAGATWLCLGWAPVAGAALRRSRRAGRLVASSWAGLGLGAAFVGSLIGGYWIVTTTWRGYFFDPTIVP